MTSTDLFIIFSPLIALTVGMAIGLIVMEIRG